MKTSTLIGVGAGVLVLGAVAYFVLADKREEEELLVEGESFDDFSPTQAPTQSYTSTPRAPSPGHSAIPPIAVKDIPSTGNYLVVLQYPQANLPSAELLVDFLRSWGPVDMKVKTPSMLQFHAPGSTLQALKSTTPDEAITLTVYPV